MTLYRTIVADPPWRYDNGTVPQGGVEHQYETMTPDELVALNIKPLAADSAHLYLWVTNVHLKEGRPFDIMEAWGFRYLSGCFSARLTIASRDGGCYRVFP